MFMQLVFKKYFVLVFPENMCYSWYTYWIYIIKFKPVKPHKPSRSLVDFCGDDDHVSM